MNTETGLISFYQPDRKRIVPRDQIEIVNQFPAELREKFQPLFCALCETKCSSNKSAFEHYSSKNHKRKVNHYLEEWSLRTGEPMPKKLCLGQDNDGVKLHCEACDLVLTSKQHAQQHYSGKQHQKVIAGKSDPTGFGHYNKDGQWVRMEPVPDKTGRFGIGSSFLEQNKSEPAANSTVAAANLLKAPEITVNKLTTTASELLMRAELNLHRASALSEIVTDTKQDNGNIHPNLRPTNLIQPPPTNIVNSNQQLPVRPLNSIQPPSTSMMNASQQLPASIVNFYHSYSSSTTNPNLLNPNQQPPVVNPIAAAQPLAVKMPINSTQVPSQICPQKPVGPTAKDFQSMEELKANVSLFCTLCSISVTSAEQMQAHKGGAKHMKKLRRTELPITYEVQPGTIIQTPKNYVDTSINVSMFRTPSGCFYCKPCNLTVDNEYQFRNHITSKRHKKGKNKYFA